METKDKKSTSENYPYYSPTPGEFPIIGVSLDINATNADIFNKELAEQYVECGFNILRIECDTKIINYNLNIAEEIGLKLLLGNQSFYNPIGGGRDLFNDVKTSPALGGYDVLDEPTYLQVTDNEPIINGIKLLKIYDEFKTYGGDKLLYINLFGANAPYSKEQPQNYVPLNEYLEGFQETIHPCVWPYDQYPIKERMNLLYLNGWNDKWSYHDKLMNGGFSIYYKSFYTALENYSKISSKSKRPFYAHCQTMCWNLYTSILFQPEALEKYLRFEVFSALAFGAQGIVYWTYGTRKNRGSELFFSALLNRNNKPTASWHYAKKINEEIKQYEYIFLGCQFVEAVRVGNLTNDQGQYIEDPIPAFNPGFGPFIAASTNVDNGILMTRITNNGNNYIIVVSRNVLKYQTVTFNNNQTIEELTPLTSKGINVTPSYIHPSVFTRNFIPGGYRIFRY